MLLTDSDLEGKYWADDYRKWHASERVLLTMDKEFVRRLSSKGWMQKYDAAAELYTRSLFESLGELKFQFQPQLQGKTPDFLLNNQFGESVVADVTVLHGGAAYESEEQQEDHQCLSQKIMDEETANFAPVISFMSGSRRVKGRGGGPISFKRILHPIRAWIRKQEDYLKSPSELQWQQSWDGNQYWNEYFEFGELGIDLRLLVRLRLKEAETKEQQKLRQMLQEGKIRVGPVSVDNPDERLEVALKKKMSYLEEFKNPQSEKILPYIVIVFGADLLSPDKDQLEKVLYGASTGYALDWGTDFEKLRQWQQRRNQEIVSYSEGLFSNRKRNFLAVLACKGYVPCPDSCEMSLWINPYASYFQIPQSLFQLKTYTLDRQVVSTLPT